MTLQQKKYYQQELKDAEHRQQMHIAKALMQGEEMERKRLAVDLHDGLGGRLAGIKINLSRIATNATTTDADFGNVIRQLDISSNELRRIARNMMPESLLQLGLQAALLDMCDSVSTIEARVIFQGYEIKPAIAPEIQMHIYRIVQELVTNAVRHGRATEILAQCSQNNSTFYITVEDNGIGFDSTSGANKNGIGLMSVKNRVGYLMGKFDIVSETNQGTTVNIEFNVHA